MGFREQAQKYRPSKVQTNFMTGLGIATVFAALMGSGFLLQKNKDTIDQLQKKLNRKNTGEGSMNDQLSGIAWYSSVLVALYGVGALINSTEGLKVFIPYIVTLVGAALFIMVGLLGYILINNQQDINDMDKDNSAIVNNTLGPIYIVVAIVGMGATIYWQFKKKPQLQPSISGV